MIKCIRADEYKHRDVQVFAEEEAVKTYTCLLKDIEDGHLDAWKEKKAPLIAQTYYKLPEDSSVYDMIKCIRADECMAKLVGAIIIQRRHNFL
ncbi:Alternative oxidase, mitochondrial precursor [Phytophthora palmivora]|uniref:Alternative oxidase, mitochondrial n=1 Tax=Phytophthora palmivora TaxID=4796 RepID=A0A2P4YR00_9STRA|nr:Alternative oxidase, mitochondrial precursor [Phytophthora palmivora]